MTSSRIWSANQIQNPNTVWGVKGPGAIQDYSAMCVCVYVQCTFVSKVTASLIFCIYPSLSTRRLEWLLLCSPPSLGWYLSIKHGYKSGMSSPSPCRSADPNPDGLTSLFFSFFFLRLRFNIIFFGRLTVKGQMGNRERWLWHAPRMLRLRGVFCNHPASKALTSVTLNDEFQY